MEIKFLNIKNAALFKNVWPKDLQSSAQVGQKLWQNSLTTTINNSELPDERKLADVTATYKKGFPTELKNYGPVSVLTAVSKVVERIIHW